MITAAIGDLVWLKEGSFVISSFNNGDGIPAGSFLNKPCKGVFLERKTISGTNYIKTYVNNYYGERLINEEDVCDIDSKEDNCGTNKI